MKLISLLFLLVTTLSNGQHILMKKDGENIPYKKIKWQEHTVEITNDKKEKIEVRKDELIGYFDGHYQRIMYQKPIVPDVKPSATQQVNNDSTTGFQYLERIKVGKINLYRKEMVDSHRTGGMTYSNSTFYYYAEKENQFKNVLITGWSSKKDDLLVNAFCQQ